jgi:hypothetical protein
MIMAFRNSPTAFQQQLGLNLESTRAPIDVMVIDPRKPAGDPSPAVSVSRLETGSSMSSAPRLFGLPAVVILAAAGPVWAQPHPMTPQQESALAGLKEYAQKYNLDLPDYMCVQITHRDVQPASGNGFPYGDEVRELVTFFGHRETYEVQSINGKPVHSGRSALGGNVSTGEFGTLLERIFDPASAAEFGYQRSAKLRGAAVDVFSYRVSKAHGYTLYSGPLREYVADWEGLIYADRATGAVLRVRMECTGIPVGFPVRHLTITLDYGPATIGGRSYNLPSHYELDQASDHGFAKNRGDYRNYRKFETEARFSPAEP